MEASLSLEGKGLTIERQCELAGVSRAGFYRDLQQEQPREEDLLLRERLQQLAVAHGRKCGYRRLIALSDTKARIFLNRRTGGTALL